MYLKGEMRRFVKKLLHALLKILPNPPPPKKKKKKDNFKKIFFKKLNLKNQSGKVIWFTKIDGLQGLLGLNLFVKAWWDENGEV